MKFDIQIQSECILFNKRFEGEICWELLFGIVLYLNEKVQSVKIHFLNIFKDHDTVAELSPTAIYYDRWSLSNDLWIKFYRDHGKYDPELS